MSEEEESLKFNVGNNGVEAHGSKTTWVLLFFMGLVTVIFLASYLKSEQNSDSVKSDIKKELSTQGVMIETLLDIKTMLVDMKAKLKKMWDMLIRTDRRLTILEQKECNRSKKSREECKEIARKLDLEEF